MVELGGAGRVVIAPDAAGEGTNALLLTPPDAIATCFGCADSFHRHRARAAAAGLAVSVHRAPALAFDLDTVDDLRVYDDRLRNHASTIRRNP
jgi:2-phospho-L-lactate guanylyltransferase